MCGVSCSSLLSSAILTSGLGDEGCEDVVMEVTSQDFMDALAKLTPSVTAEELKRYKEMEKTSH